MNDENKENQAKGVYESNQISPSIFLKINK